MTALVAYVADNEIYVAMDTLVSNPFDHMRPSLLRRKFFVNGSDVVLAGTGHADFILKWFDFVESHSNDFNIDMLNHISTMGLNSLAPSVLWLNETPTTIYHFGFSSNKGCLLCYRYHSKNRFLPEMIRESLIVKPDYGKQEAYDLVLGIGFVEAAPTIMQRLQEADNHSEKKVGIGGDIELVRVYNKGASISVLGSFPSKAKEEEYINKNR